MIRTTVSLDEDIFKQARKEAIDRRYAFGNLVNQALKSYLQKPKKITKHKFELKIYRMGQTKGSLKRSEIYENI